MSEFHHDYLPERNPVTHRIHRREVLWQITVPVLVGAVVLLALAVLVIFFANNASVSRWADISLIWLILPMLFVVLITTIVVGGIAYGIIWLVHKIPVWMRQLQDLVTTIGVKIRQLTDAMVEPILRVQAFVASVEALRQNLSRR